MSHRLVLTPEAEAEIDEASRWYGTNNSALRPEFLRDVENALSTIEAAPVPDHLQEYPACDPSSLSIWFDVHRF